LSGTSLTVDQFNQPGRLVATGMAGLKPLFTYMENMGAIQKLTNWWVVWLYAGICWIAMLSYFLIASHIILATIEFQLIAVYGAVMIPWGVVSHTAFMAEAAIGGIVSSAVRLGVLAFVVGLINPVILSIATPASVLDGTDLPYWHALAAMMGAALMMLISWMVPNYAASLLGSGPALTGSALVGMGVGAVSGGVRAGRRLMAA
jgi:type IV secretion system protein TrbL